MPAKIRISAGDSGKLVIITSSTEYDHHCGPLQKVPAAIHTVVICDFSKNLEKRHDPDCRMPL